MYLLVRCSLQYKIYIRSTCPRWQPVHHWYCGLYSLLSRIKNSVIQGENVISRLVWKTGKHKSQLDKRKLAMSGPFWWWKALYWVTPSAWCWFHIVEILSTICHYVGPWTTGFLPLLIILQTKDWSWQEVVVRVVRLMEERIDLISIMATLWENIISHCDKVISEIRSDLLNARSERWHCIFLCQPWDERDEKDSQTPH